MNKVLRLLLAVSVVSFAMLASASAENVTLRHARPFNYAAGGFSWNYTDISVHVNNVGTEEARRVVVVYRAGFDPFSPWAAQECSLQGAFLDHSLYTASIASTIVEFAIGYETSEGWFWDSNGGANYRVAAWQPAHGEPGDVGNNVALAEMNKHVNYYSVSGMTYSWPSLEGQLYVKNRGYNKQVGIIATTDWVNWYAIPAVYLNSMSLGGASDVEVWQIEEMNISSQGLTSGIEFVVYYQDVDSGEVYWDNNFGQDYYIPASYDEYEMR